MFGKSSFGSGGFGQQQQQQPANTGFGQQAAPQQTGFGGFGATPNTTSAFGQPAQQASAFGGGLNAPATGGFGATNTTSTFGQPKPTGFGAAAPSAFGSNQATAPATGFGGGGAFGAANNNTTSAFGGNQQSGGLFGQQQARPANAFGGATGGFGQPQQQQQQQPQQQQQQQTGFGGGGFGNQAAAGGAGGTAQADFAPTQDRDVTTGMNHFFQSVSAMPQYKNFSFEELRLQDYNQNRKNASAAGAATGGAFGGGAFGQQQQTTGAFGGGNATGGAFGGGNTGGAFGAANTGGGAFGAANTGGAFGQTTQAGSGLFGQQPAATGGFGQAAGATGGFGQASGGFGQPSTSSSLFGQPSTSTAGAFGQQPAAAGGAFGNTANKPGFSFGGNNAAAGGGFGQPAAAGGAFGQQPAATGAFGQPAAAAAPAAAGGFGGFGAKPTLATGGFGAAGGATGGFGQQPAAGGFGAAAPANKPGFSFGANNAAAGATGGLGFGNAATGGFGQQQQQQQPAAGGMFGNAAAKPATGGLFGAGAAGATGGFGGFGQTSGALGGMNTGAAGAGGLGFGAKPTLGATGGFGALGGGLGQQPGLGGATSGFGALGGGGGLGMMGQQQGSYNLPTQGGLTSFGTNNVQNGLIATIDNNTYGSNPLFDLAGNRNPNYNKLNTPAEATAVAVSGANERHKSTHFPASPRVVSRIKLRGFTFPTKGSGVTRVTSSLNNNVDTDQDATLGAQAFRNKPLFFDGNETENVAQTLAQTSRKKVTFNTDLEHGSFTSSPVLASSPAPSPLAAPARVDDNVAAAESEGYSMTPSYQQLVTMSRDQLKSVQLTVTRQGFGIIAFDQPVDLSDVPLSQIMGHFIVIQNKTIVVYPEQVRKPSPGQQLNVPATITLENCFTTDKHTGNVLTDPQHPRVAAFIKKLQDRPNVEFVDYDASSSKWTFKVKSF